MSMNFEKPRTTSDTAESMRQTIQVLSGVSRRSFVDNGHVHAPFAPVVCIEMRVRTNDAMQKLQALFVAVLTLLLLPVALNASVVPLTDDAFTLQQRQIA